MHDPDTLLMKRRLFIQLLPMAIGLAQLSPAIAAAHKSPGIVELNVSSDGDFLAFAPDELTCRTGTNVRVIFHHTGERITQQHNWVLLRPGSEEAFITASLKVGETNGWVPPGDKNLIAATPLCGLGKSAMAEFTAPAPGDYPFVCSFAGHGEEMRGMLHVTA